MRFSSFFKIIFFATVFHDKLSPTLLRLYLDIPFTIWSSFVSIGCLGNKI